jgi:hypothetical protein
VLSEWQTVRILIWGKTYPELSTRHTETVCTAGVVESGSPIRLYPVSFRYLEESQRYKLYDVVEARVRRNLSDPRPESHKVDLRSLRIVDHIEPDRDRWFARRQWIDRNQSAWHCDSVDVVLRRQAEGYQSMALVSVGGVEDCYLAARTAEQREKFESKSDALSSQSDLFSRDKKQLDFIPYEIRMKWRCADGCARCRVNPHDMSVLDWGLVQLGRRDGWEKAAARLASIAQTDQHEFKVFLGNFFTHQKTFGIIGLWFPKITSQGSLF